MNPSLFVYLLFGGTYLIAFSIKAYMKDIRFTDYTFLVLFAITWPILAIAGPLLCADDIILPSKKKKKAN